MFISAASTISHQPTFQNKGFSLKLSELDPSSELITPNYGEFIPVMDRRRMSHVLKMSIACSIDCLAQSGLKEPDAIIVGTSMGCCIHTKNFLDKIISSNHGLVSPTSFIVSTHNTIAGQISLLLSNHGYNMTHTQNSLSFEQGLIDALLCLKDGYSNVLVGGADEEENTIYNMHERLKDPHLHITSGAAFFLLSNEKITPSPIKLMDVETIGLIEYAPTHLTQFLESNNLSAHEIDLVLYCNTDKNKTMELETIFGADKISDYQKITGTYLTNSAFAMHYGIDLLSTTTPGSDNLKKILVCNNLIPENLGLVLLSKEDN